jgi:predicted alpha/beta hydrolase
MWITCTDGERLAYTLSTPAPELAAVPERYIIINSATGVQRGYYHAFAQHLCSLGCHVLTWDARGIGESQKEHARHSVVRMRDWGALDFEAVLQHVHALASGDWQRISVIGHSSGGHLSGLAPSLRHVKNLILIASGTCDWRLYPIKQWPRLLLVWYGLAPLMLKTLGYWPGRLGVGHDLPSGVAWDWRNWSATRGYLFGDMKLDLSGYSEFSGHLLALHFTDDQDFAPPNTVRDLVKRFSNANTDLHEYDPRSQKRPSVGHFGFFHKKHVTLWPLIHARLGLLTG